MVLCCLLSIKGLYLDRKLSCCILFCWSLTSNSTGVSVRNGRKGGVHASRPPPYTYILRDTESETDDWERQRNRDIERERESKTKQLEIKRNQKQKRMWWNAMAGTWMRLFCVPVFLATIALSCFVCSVFFLNNWLCANVCSCIWICAYGYSCMQRPEKGDRLHGTGIAGTWKQINLCTGHHTLVLCRSSTYPQLQRNLFLPLVRIFKAAKIKAR